MIGEKSPFDSLTPIRPILNERNRLLASVDINFRFARQPSATKLLSLGSPVAAATDLLPIYSNPSTMNSSEIWRL